jgi:ubiquinone/menaquinone biosynthesis C-methylase UbiE
MALPCSDEAVDSYTIAFGIRNVTSIPAALEEAYRVGGSQLHGEMLCIALKPMIFTVGSHCSRRQTRLCHCMQMLHASH